MKDINVSEMTFGDVVLKFLSNPRKFSREFVNLGQQLETEKKKTTESERTILEQQGRIANLEKTNEDMNSLENIKKKFSTIPLGHSIAKPNLIGHLDSVPYLSSQFNKPGIRILEIGSRNVTGGTSRAPFRKAEYVGFDFYAGENVDIVGDAHKLSSYFKDGEQFDLIISMAVFEHLYAPWVVAQEIQKMLKPGGHLFVETHFSYISHERPWNFFQFSDMGLRALFNRALGFEVIDCGMSNPMNGVFNILAESYLSGMAVGELYCHSEILCRKVAEPVNFEWTSTSIDDIVESTRYPEPKAIA